MKIFGYDVKELKTHNGQQQRCILDQVLILGLFGILLFVATSPMKIINEKFTEDFELLTLLASLGMGLGLVIMITLYMIHISLESMKHEIWRIAENTDKRRK